MTETMSVDSPAAQAIREAAGELAAHRKRPCLLYVSRQVVYTDVLTVGAALDGVPPAPLDVLVASPGGDIEAAYLVARELRRRTPALAVYLPFRVKSAAALLALAADELVFGGLGELGPLDAQYEEKQAHDFPLSASRLLLDTALKEVEERAIASYDQAINRILKASGMKPFEACTKAAEFVGTLYGPLLAKLDPVRLAESARGLSLGRAYATRLLRRYRPTLPEADRHALLDRLVTTYPAHSFIIDAEEATDLGLPVRDPDPTEAGLLDRLCLSLIEFGIDEDLIELVRPPAKRIAASGREKGGVPRPEPARHGKRSRARPTDTSRRRGAHDTPAT
jgi:hypothetical protein